MLEGEDKFGIAVGGGEEEVIVVGEFICATEGFQLAGNILAVDNGAVGPHLPYSVAFAGFAAAEQVETEIFDYTAEIGAGSLVGILCLSFVGGEGVEFGPAEMVPGGQ